MVALSTDSRDTAIAAVHNITHDVLTISNIVIFNELCESSKCTLHARVVQKSRKAMIFLAVLMGIRFDL